MKTTRFLLILIAVASLAARASYATEPSAKLPEKDSRELSQGIHSVAIRPGNKDQAGPVHSLLNNNGHVAPKINPVVPLHPQTARSSETALHQQGQGTANPATTESMINKTAGFQPPKPPSAVNETPALSPGAAHVKSATAASLGGLAVPGSRNSIVALNGTTMKRKH